MGPAFKIISGCDHAFCEACIVDWCCNHRALCPICQQPVFALHTTSQHTYLLSPHFGTFGIELTGNEREATIARTEHGCIAAKVGLRVGDIVKVNDERSARCAYDALNLSLKMERMARVDLITSEDNRCGCLCAFARKFQRKARVGPYEY